MEPMDLNLLEGQHVILAKPLLNLAVEAQAISEVHRIGQTQKTLVYQSIMEDTVEVSLSWHLGGTHCKVSLRWHLMQSEVVKKEIDMLKWPKREKAYCTIFKFKSSQWKFDIWKWPNRNKIVGIQWKVNMKFEKWRWPNRKKRRWKELCVKLVSCGKEDLYIRWVVGRTVA